MFVGRRRELGVLEEAFAQDRSAFVPIYGRRRVGKSELILQFLRGKPAVYPFGKQAPASPSDARVPAPGRRGPRRAAAGDGPGRGLGGGARLVIARWRGDGKLVLALDEFQWMAGASPELPSVLQELWDRALVEERPGPADPVRLLRRLHGAGGARARRARCSAGARRRSSCSRSASARPPRSIPATRMIERARAYFVCGGVPLYLRAFDAVALGRAEHRRRVVARRVRACCTASPTSSCARSCARSRATTPCCPPSPPVADAATRHRRGGRASGIARLHYYLAAAASRSATCAALPADREQADPARGPLRPRRSPASLLVPLRLPEHQLPRRMPVPSAPSPTHHARARRLLRRLLRAAVPRGAAGLYRAEGVTAPFEVGEYWDTDGTDRRGRRAGGRLDRSRRVQVGSRAGSAAALTAELEAKVPAYPNARNATIIRRLFVQLAPRSRATRDAARWHTLSDLAQLDH